MAVISSPNHWWQNWPKTHGYVASRMFFPKSVEEIAGAIKTAEADQRPLRAVGGGWSFSDASLPGMVITNRPNVYAVEALSAVVPKAEHFPTDGSKPCVATVEDNTPAADARESMVMLEQWKDDNPPPKVDANAIYEGFGLWSWNGKTWGGVSGPGFLKSLGVTHRPIRAIAAGQCREEADSAGSLVMFDLAVSSVYPSRDWFYNGNGVWSVGVAGDSARPTQGDLPGLSHENRLTPLLSPRAARPGQSLSLLLSRWKSVPALPEPVYLMNTRSLASSLQQRLPSILSDVAKDATSSSPSARASQQFLFHVEAGITIADLGELLAHQSPRLSLQAISGSPGASLAGALATGTHGAEFNWPLLVDTVKAVHLVGPGGLQWWIEGDEPIADPQKLQAAYPGLARERIISGKTAVDGIVPQDWLKAAVVSMGSIGVVYSVVLEVVPLFGVHEVVVEKSWRQLGAELTNTHADLATQLRSSSAKDVSKKIVAFLQDGTLNGTLIPRADGGGRPVNQYADLAINPNRGPGGELDCWIGNRELTPELPLESQPSTDMLKGIGSVLSSPVLSANLKTLYGFGSIPDYIGNFLTYSGARGKLGRLTRASDFADAALDTFLTPMAENPPYGLELAQAILTGILSGLLGTANCARRADTRGVSVGALGFPASGLMGAGLEIALAPADAFGFLQVEILDRVDPDKPFFGYVSIRLCSKTETLMGMQQFGDPCSVMIEVVGWGNDYSREFIRDLQRRTALRIESGLEAMLHWGLENDELTAKHLWSLKALQAPTRSGLGKFDTFRVVRALIQAAGPSSYRVFDNRFTQRFGLTAEIDDQPYGFDTLRLHDRRSVVFHFRNAGPGTMRMVAPSVDGDFRTAPSAAGAQVRPRNLELEPLRATALPGEEIELRVTFLAESPGPHEGTLTILAAAANVPDGLKVLKIRLRAQVEAFAVSIVQPQPPAVLDLGSVALGDYKTAQITVHSDSTMDAWLDSYELSEPTAMPQISVVTSGVGPVPRGGTRSFSVVFEPNAVGEIASNLTLTFSSLTAPPGYSQQLVLRVVGIGVGVQAELSPATVEFGTVALGLESALVPVVLRNVGQRPLIVSGILIGPDFRVIPPHPTAVAPGQAEEMSVVFRPGHAGPLSSSFSISSNSARPPAPVLLEGIGLVQELLRATPESVEYEATPVGSESGEEILLVANEGPVEVTLQSLGIVGPDASDFRIVRASRTPGAVMRPEEICEIRVVLAPRSVGRKAATLEVAHQGVTSPLRVPLQGRAIMAVGLVPSRTELDFGSVAVREASRESRLAMTNGAATEVHVTGATITGRNALDFAIVSEESTNDALEPGTSCTIVLSAKPGAMGPREAELTVTAEGSATVVPLRVVGLGVTVEWSAALIEFSGCKVGSTSLRRDAYIRNTGNEALDVTLVDTEGDFAVQVLAPEVLSIPPNGDTSFWVWFKPTAAGPRAGSLRVHVNGPGSLQSLVLTGVGV
jgi:hypothetical protein